MRDGRMRCAMKLHRIARFDSQRCDCQRFFIAHRILPSHKASRIASYVHRVVLGHHSFRLLSARVRNHGVGYFDPLLWAVILIHTFCIGDKCTVVFVSKIVNMVARGFS